MIEDHSLAGRVVKRRVGISSHEAMEIHDYDLASASPFLDKSVYNVKDGAQWKRCSSWRDNWKSFVHEKKISSSLQDSEVKGSDTRSQLGINIEIRSLSGEVIVQNLVSEICGSCVVGTGQDDVSHLLILDILPVESHPGTQILLNTSTFPLWAGNLRLEDGRVEKSTWMVANLVGTGERKSSS